MLGLALAGCGTTPAERRASIYSLKAAPSESNVAEIRALLDDPDRDVRATALNALAQLDAEDEERLLRQALEDEDGFVRATAAKLLADLGSRDNADVLAEHLLGDPDPLVRQRAAEALAVLGGEPAIVALVRALDDPMQPVRLAVVEGVLDLAPGRAIDPLVRMLAEDGAWEIRVRAARALGASGDPRAEPALEAALGDPNEFVRAAAAHALDVHEAAVPPAEVPVAEPEPGSEAPPASG